MTLPVSTSSRDLVSECGGGSVLGGIVGDAVEPASVDDADPGAGQDAGGVRVVLTAGDGVMVDLRGPGAGVSAVVGEGGDRLAESLVAGPAEIGGYLALADAQPTAGRRMRAAGLVCLGAGAGLIRGDLRDARGSDVSARSGGVVVTVRGARPRTVPVLARYHARLLAAARSAGTGLICGGTDPARRNLTNPLIIALDGGGGLPRLDTSRLRATWLRDCAELLGLATFMHAAGISCSQRLGDLLAGLEPGSEDEAVRLLGAARRP